MIHIEDWGEIPYQDAFDLQKKRVDEILQGKAKEQIVFCSHPPVVTLGRGTLPQDIFGWQGETVEVNRGGRATYHGPNQVIVYPLVYLGKSREEFSKKKIPPNDLHAYMRALEDSVIDVLKTFGIESAVAQPLKAQVGEEEQKEATGVWIGDKKIAALGIAVKSWVASHGVALNVWKDPDAFVGINPCGFRGDQVTTLEDILKRPVERPTIINSWAQALQMRLLA